MWAIGPPARAATPALVVAAADPDRDVRMMASGALGSVGPPAAEAAEALGRVLADKDPLVRGAAAKALGRFGPAAAPAVPALTTALVDRDRDVAVQAAYALGAAGRAGEPALPVLRGKQRAADPNLRVRLSATMADGPPPSWWPVTSTTFTESPRAGSFRCPAERQGNKCLDCRACFDGDVADVAYPLK